MRIVEFKFDRQRDIAWAAERARLLASLAGVPQKARTHFGKAVKVTVEHAVGLGLTGTIQYALSDDNTQAIEVVIRYSIDADEGDLNPIDLDTVRCPIVDVQLIHQDDIAEIRLVTARPNEASPILPEVASDWATTLATRDRSNALSQSQRRISDLAGSLESAQRRGVNLESELENLRSLNETLELLALVASKTDNAVIILDAQHCIEWVNDSFVRMTGYELPEVHKLPLLDVLASTVVDSDTRDAFQQAFAAGHGVTQELLHQRKDGNTYWASISITPAFSDDGTIHRWIGMASDATQRRHAQEALRKAKDEAELASHIKSEFLANMSHEIRTPMNAVIGMSELALDTTLDEEQREYVSTILDSAENLLRLLNDILDLSKIEAQKLSIESVDFALSEAVRDAFRPFAFQAKQKGLILDLDLPLELPERLVGDPLRLRQVIANLTGNAIKFTAEGSVRITVSTPEVSNETATLKVSVIDTGIGIPKDRLDRIFEAFSQVDSSTSRRFGGTGLGLTISTQLVELMNGRIWVESEEGVGSTFSFEIPFAITQVQATPNAASAQRSESIVQASEVSSLLVLIADDNRANRRLARKILEKRQHRIVEAASGEEVVELVQTSQFDAILMDVQMPGMDGIETTQTLRQLELSKQPYIVALTAHAMQGDRERCLAAGMDTYMAKPIRAKHLLALIDAVATSQTPTPESNETQIDESISTSLDFAAALDRLEGDKDLLVEQMAFYLEDSPILVRDIEDAVAELDAKKLEMAAHRLRGIAAGFDASELALVASHLEGIGRSGELSDTPSAISGLRHAWHATCTEIRQYLE